MATGWNDGLCQDYDKGLGRWFADRLGARQQLRRDFEMTQVPIDRATLEQLVRMLEQCLDDAIQVQCDLEQGYSKSLALAQMVQVELSKEALSAGRAALANAEPAGWQTLVDHGKEAHELAKIMKDFADKNPESLMLKELDN